jgi:uncharacterized protein
MFQYSRSLLPHILNCLNKNQIAIIFGTRQVGKTTITGQIITHYKTRLAYKDKDIMQLNGDFLSHQTQLSVQELKPLQNLVGNAKLLIVDEAQRIENIGINIKILHDNVKGLNIVLTGSSSLDLANKINEPLTGRAEEFLLTPLSFGELSQVERNWVLVDNIEQNLIYGSYPMVINSKSNNDKVKVLNNLTSNYLYKDILEWDKIKKSNMVSKLLQLLALQIGSTVSYHKLATILEINTDTVSKYIDLLEKCFVIIKLPPFSRNKSKELTNAFKIYFWDLGVRNSLINNFNELEFRQDIGELWENFCVIERAKLNINSQRFVKSYFWRNYAQNEVDLIEEKDGKLNAFEFKYGKDKMKKGSYNFTKEYENASLTLINKENITDFLN